MENSFRHSLSNGSGYHIYKEVWNAEIHEELRCEREVGNHSNTFAVAVKKGTVTVGHIPRCISSICSIVIRQGDNIKCSVTAVINFTMVLAAAMADDSISFQKLPDGSLCSDSFP